MVGIIRRREQVKIIEPPSPDDFFDPTTHIATEENFIKFLQAGIYTDEVIGYKVQLSNTVDYNNGLWVIADVNHDSTNTGQENCYDLISEGCFHSAQFMRQDWRSYSTPRTWLNDTFYPGFSTEFKNHILNLKYNSRGTWYNDDKVILPSKVEINGGTASFTDSEGVVYPIFTGTTGIYNNTSRVKNYNGSAYSWWTRSRYTNDSSQLWAVNSSGGLWQYNASYRYYLAPVLRVS